MRRSTLAMAALALSVSLGTACEEEEEVDLGPSPPPLQMPDLTGLDMGAGLEQGLQLVLGADLRAPWAAFEHTLELSSPGCPDLYAGSSEDEGDDGLRWYDNCTTPGGLTYSGELHWLATAESETDEAGTVVTGERSIDGTAAVDGDEGRLFGFIGEASDALYRSSGEGYDRWTYSASLTATVTGADLLGDDAPFPGGWREDLYLNYTGGEQDLLEVRGDLYLLQDTFDRFDSVSLDITLQGPAGAAPTACVAEPAGYIGLRDRDAFWYEVVFLPSDADTTNPPEGLCDGCGRLFVRGVEQPDPVCVSFDWIWERLTPPGLEDYIFTTRY